MSPGRDGLIQAFGVRPLCAKGCPTSREVSLSGCAGVGVVSTSDPRTKLSDARYLYSHEGRPLIAERLIQEAIGIFQQTGDDVGLGEAYFDYAYFFLSPYPWQFSGRQALAIPEILVWYACLPLVVSVTTLLESGAIERSSLISNSNSPFKLFRSRATSLIP